MTPFERWSVWLTTAGTLLTGVLYWWMKDMMTPPDPWAVVNHPLQPWLLKAHILIAPLQVFTVGLITSRHVWRHFKLGVQKGRKSGLLAAGTFIALVFTGYALQVVTADLLIRVFAWSHLVLGVVYSVGVAAHWPATRSRDPGETALGPLQEPGSAASPRPRSTLADGAAPRGPARRETASRHSG